MVTALYFIVAVLVMAWLYVLGLFISALIPPRGLWHWVYGRRHRPRQSDTPEDLAHLSWRNFTALAIPIWAVVVLTQLHPVLNAG